MYVAGEIYFVLIGDLSPLRSEIWEAIEPILNIYRALDTYTYTTDGALSLRTVSDPLFPASLVE